MFYPNSMKKEQMESIADQQLIAQTQYVISKLNIEDRVLWQKGSCHEYYKARAAYQKMLKMWKENDVDTMQ